MKKILILFLIFSIGSCSIDNFDDLNTDKKHPTDVPGETLFTSAVRELVDQVSECSVNFNVYRLYSQYWAQTTYPDESQYNMVGRNIPDRNWSVYYKDVLRDLNEASRIIGETAGNATVQSNKQAIINIVEGYAYQNLVDLFGDIPYTQALDISNTLPVYDDGRMVYDDIINKVQNAVSQLDAGSGSFAGDEDLVYGGDVVQWIKFGNSLLLRMAIRIADVDGAAAKSIVESVAGNVFQSSSDDFAMPYFSASPNTNPLYEQFVLSGRNDFIAANTIVDIMNELEDPRRELFFDANMEDGEGNTMYLGGEYGTANAFSGFTHINSSYVENPSLPGNLLTYSEVQFLLADAAARGYNVGGTVEEYYNEAITASIIDWGGSKEMADTYLSNPKVAYETADGDWRMKIGKQKWLSLFDNGGEGWTTWRLYDMDFFNVPEGLRYSDIPTRLIYPTNEETLNKANNAAASAKYGDDSPSAKIFWDIY